MLEHRYFCTINSRVQFCPFFLSLLWNASFAKANQIARRILIYCKWSSPRGHFASATTLSWERRPPPLKCYPCLEALAVSEQLLVFITALRRFLLTPTSFLPPSLPSIRNGVFYTFPADRFAEADRSTKHWSLRSPGELGTQVWKYHL